MEIDVATLNRILENQSRMILAQVSAMLGERPAPIAREGIIQSYDPTNGTIEVIFGDGDTIQQNAGAGDLGDQPPTERNVRLLVMHHGDQFGPIGNERCVVVPTQSGYAAHIVHDEDDSPGAPAGERWITHRDPTTGEVDCFIKLTNAGSVTNDGKGGVMIGWGELAEILTTNGIKLILDDNAQRITEQTAGGNGLIVDDATNSVQLQGGSNEPENAVIRKSDLDAALAAQTAQTKADIIAWALAHVPNGSGNAGPSSMTAVTSNGSTKTFSG